MVRPVGIVVALLATMALGLFLTAPALAQGGSSGPSAGDNQYIDPLANPQTQPKHKLKTRAHKPNPAPSSRSSSSTPSQPATPTQTSAPSGSVATTGAPAGTGVAATGRAAAVAHRKKTSALHAKKASTTLTVASRKTSTTTVAPPPPAISSASHPGSSFPYVYLIVAICAALGAALLGRRVLLRRAARRT